MGSTLWADPAGLNNLMGSSCVLGPVFDFTVPGVLPLGATFSRASKATLFDAAGTLQEVADNVPAWTYDPTTLALLGLNNEELRTNGVRNPRMEGGNGGTPGTPPTNMGGVGIPSGLSRQLGFGVETGISYIDLRYSGTNTNSATNASLFNFESTTQILAAQNQTWAALVYAYLISTTGNVTIQLASVEADASGVGLAASPAVTIGATSGPLSARRVSVTRQLGNASTARIYPRLQYTAAAGAVIDFTVRLGVPQLEQGTGSSSIILPPVAAPAATTRAVAVVNLALANGIHNIDIYRASGLTSLTNVVVSGGSYPVPTDLSPLWLVIPKRIA